MEMFRRRYGANIAFMNVQIVEGGKERFDSVANALAMVKPEATFVAIHDAVRPCLTDELITSVFGAAEKFGAALLAMPATDTIKRADDQGHVLETVPRQGLWLAQTPQVFRRQWIMDAYAKLDPATRDITDDTQIVEKAGHKVVVVEGSSTNIKITSKSDLFLAEAILKSRPKPKAAGPIHPFAEEEMWGGWGKKS
jgi:2-C-methyl-D-erythritol 4-phosphate cytidylyltransferase